MAALLELPSPREVELETLLRQREKQLTELTDEVTYLRQYLSTQPPPSTNEAFTLPPALLSILLPHINARHDPATASLNALGAEHASGSSATAALMQRARLLQGENDELYGLLRHSEVGKLREEAAALRKLVQRLEKALKESHGVISSLSDELEQVVNSKVAEQPLSSNFSQLPRPAPTTSQPSRSNGYGPRAQAQIELPIDGRSISTGPSQPKKQRIASSGREAPPHGSVNGDRSARDDRERDHRPSEVPRDRRPRETSHERDQDRRLDEHDWRASEDRDRRPPEPVSQRDRGDRRRSRSRSPRRTDRRESDHGWPDKREREREPDQGWPEDRSHRGRSPSRSRSPTRSRSRERDRNGGPQRRGGGGQQDPPPGKGRSGRRRGNRRGNRRSPSRHDSGLANRLGPP